MSALVFFSIHTLPVTTFVKGSTTQWLLAPALIKRDLDLDLNVLGDQPS